MSEGPSEGSKLRDVLGTIGCSQRTFGRAAGVSGTSVGRWFQGKTFTPLIWAKIRSGLLALALDPKAVRPNDRVPLPAMKEAGPEDLRPLLANAPVSELERIRKILSASPEARERLLYFLDGYLSKRH